MIDLALIEHIYDVAMGRSDWAEALERLRRQFLAEESLLILYGPSPGEVRCLGMSAFGDRPWDEYSTHYGAVDPYAQAMGSARFPAGRVLGGDEVVPAKILLASEFYNDWFRPNGVRYTAGGFVQSRGAVSIMLAMPRAADAGAYRPGEIADLQGYFNHLYRAAEIQAELRSRRPEPDLDRIARSCGLTPAEARLVELLAETGSLKDGAKRLGRSYYTARSQLQSVFSKTGTRSQIQLMRLIHRHDSTL